MKLAGNSRSRTPTDAIATSTHRRWKRVGLLLALGALTLLGFVGYTIASHSPRDHQSERDCRLITAQLRSTAAERSALSRVPGAPTAVFLGDSYAQGLELPDVRDSYVYVTAKAKHWRAVVNAIGGTGYVNGGPCGGQQLITRVPRVVALRPSVVIVQAGLNDAASPPSAVRSAAAALLAVLRRNLPHARIVTVGPHPTPGLPHIDATINAIRAASEAEHVQFIDTGPWPIQFGIDREHPTVQGHSTYGRLLARTLGSTSA
jgi:lysophospholipase L1-like esterase